MTSHAVKDFISPEVLTYREQSHSLKAGSSKPNTEDRWRSSPVLFQVKLKAHIFQ